MECLTLIVFPQIFTAVLHLCHSYFIFLLYMAQTILICQRNWNPQNLKKCLTLQFPRLLISTIHSTLKKYFSTEKEALLLFRYKKHDLICCSPRTMMNTHFPKHPPYRALDYYKNHFLMKNSKILGSKTTQWILPMYWYLAPSPIPASLSGWKHTCLPTVTSPHDSSLNIQLQRNLHV